MRVKVRKFLFVGAGKDKETFFSRAQEAGLVEFIDKRKKFAQEVPEDLEILHEAHKILLGQHVRPSKELRECRTALDEAREVVLLREEIGGLYEERRVLKLDIARVEPFGDFDLEEVAFIENVGQRQIQYFFTNKTEKIEAPKRPEVFHVGHSHGMDYFIAFNKEKSSYPGMIEMQIDAPVGVLRERYQDVTNKIADKEKQLAVFAEYREVIDDALIDKLNEHNLDTAADYVQYTMDDRVFAVEGWTAECDMKELGKLLDDMDIHCEEIAIDAKERIPTYLHNEGFARIGQDVINIYDTPSVQDKDPSKWVLWVFALFFAVIIGDGGYGLIFLILSLILRYKFPTLKGAGKRVLNLFTILAVSCIVWGVLTNSFFGIDIGLHNPLRKFSLVQHLVEKKADYEIMTKGAIYQSWVQKDPSLSNVHKGIDFIDEAVTIISGKKVHILLSRFTDNIMLELALMMGVIHIAISFLRNIRKNWAGAGWIMFMIGAYLFFPSILKATSIIHFSFGVDKIRGASAGLELIYWGVGVAFVLSIIQNKLGGLKEPFTVIQVFADVLSYLRLYALALAGTMMSGTFNAIGENMGVVVGIVVIILGHTVNITLSTMGGVIHGLRLNFLEWYHYCFEGGGKLLKPLMLLKR